MTHRQAALAAETGADASMHSVCCPAEGSMPQLDFAPSMAALMGVPIPFGNIGRITRPLWDAAHSMGSDSSASCGRGTEVNDSRQDAFTAALRENAAQVGDYLGDLQQSCLL